MSPYEAKYTHEQRVLRRRKLANAVKKLPLEKRAVAVSTMAVQFGVSFQTAYQACREFQVAFPPRTKQNQISTLCILAKLRRGERAADIAKFHGLSRQRISQIKAAGISAGLLDGWRNGG